MNKKGDTYSILSLLEFINQSPALSKAYGKLDNVVAVQTDESPEKEIVEDQPLLVQTYKEYEANRANLTIHQHQISTRYQLTLMDSILLYRDNFSSLQSLFHNKYDLNRFHMLLDRLTDSSQQVNLLKAHFLKLGVINEDGSNTKELMRCLSSLWDSDTKELWNKYCIAVDRLTRPKDVLRVHPTDPVIGPDGFLLYPLGFFKGKNPNEQVYHPTNENSYVTISHRETVPVQPVPKKRRPASPVLPPYSEDKNPFFWVITELEKDLSNTTEYLNTFKTMFEWKDYERRQITREPAVSTYDWSTPTNVTTPVTKRSAHPFEAFSQYRQAIVDRFPNFTKEQIDDRLLQEYRRFSEGQTEKYAQIGNNHQDWTPDDIAREMDKWREQFFQKTFLTDFPVVNVVNYPTKTKRLSVRQKMERIIQLRYPAYPTIPDLAARLEERAYNRFPPRPKQNDAYTYRISLIFRSLQDPENSLLDILVNGEILPEDLTMMNDIELFSERQKAQQREKDAIRYRDNQDRTIITTFAGVPTTDYQCEQCNSRNAHYIEKQTRSADEPMTLFIRCDQCGNQWRD